MLLLLCVTDVANLIDVSVRLGIFDGVARNGVEQGLRMKKLNDKYETMENNLN